MAQQLINIGASPNDGTGTPLRTSFDYTNQNFTELYAASGVGASSNTQVLFNDSGVVNGDAGLTYVKATDALTVTGPLSTGGTLAVTGATTLTGAATVQTLTVGKGNGAIATNTAFGISALAAVTASSNCTALGNLSLPAVTTGLRNTAVGSEALKSLESGHSNSAVGYFALRALVSGTSCTAIGDIAAYQSTGSNTTSVGYGSLNVLIAGDGNTAVGWNAGLNQTAGGNNGFFGYGSYADNTTGDNQYNYGNASVATHKFRAGNVVLGAGNVVLASAQGIDFTATANSSGTMTSELLNDYEEGTWVPTDASGAGVGITGTACRYTKIGRAVTIQGIIGYAANASTTAARIGGIPFNFPDIAPLNLSYIGSGGSTVFYIIGAGGSNQLEFYGNAGNGIQNTTLAGLSAYISGTYYTT